MIDFRKLPSPCYVLDERLLDANLAVIDRVRRETGVEIIVALKACAMWRIFPELAKHSDGATASSAAEARLVFETFGRPAHTYAPVYTDAGFEEIMRRSDHITFNSSRVRGWALRPKKQLLRAVCRPASTGCISMCCANRVRSICAWPWKRSNGISDAGWTR